MMRLFWKLMLGFCLAFIAIDVSHSAALQFVKRFDIAAVSAIAAADARGDSIANAVATYGSALLMAGCLSALMAWYLSRPIRIMRRAFNALSEGRLDTRVRHLIGSQRDDLADLGRDFDGMAHRLENMVDLQQRVLQEVSHELRSPLTRLQTAIGLAQQNPHDIHATLDRIENESLRLQAMLENMLMLAQMEAGGKLAPRSEIDLIELLAGVARDAHFEAQAQDRAVNFCALGECLIGAHAQLLYRAFENVVRNAVKYTDPGTAVDIAVEYGERRVRVSVADRGPGVDAGALHKIFEPFYRIPEQQRQTQGFGLGLAIARSAVKFHGGAIAAENRPHGGLIVDIDLPLAEK